ncbi:MAG: hypothetical protein LBR26_04810 [Prevotella sp.]|jgi:hypothetical protein|nr:hypothetical protein [Prevotella sp.]
MITVEEISVLLKNNGLNRKTRKACPDILKSSPKSGKQKIFNAMFIEYMDYNMNQISTKKRTLMCTSDVIETVFGRYKNELNQNPANGITDMALIIPAMTSDLNREEIMKAIDASTVKQINQWQKDNLCDSLSVMRNEFYNTKSAS